MDKNESDYVRMQFNQVNKKLENFSDIYGKIFDRLDTMNTILARNTVIVDEHQKRSTTLEKEFNKQEDRVVELEKSMIRMNNSIGKIEPLEKRCENLETQTNKTNGLFAAIPLGFKIVGAFFGLIMTSFGLYKMIPELVEWFSKSN